jgi:hypothetical protein
MITINQPNTSTSTKNKATILELPIKEIRVTVQVELKESVKEGDLNKDDVGFENSVDIVLHDILPSQIADAAMDIYAGGVGVSMPEQFMLTIVNSDDTNITYDASHDHDPYSLAHKGHLA